MPSDEPRRVPANPAPCSHWAAPTAQDERRDQDPPATTPAQPTDLSRVMTDAYAQRASRGWQIAETLYSREELAPLPTAVVPSALGLGNPVRDATIRPGEVVLDVGCGTGIDLLLALPHVGAKGRVIGLDLTPELIHQARRHVAQVGAGNVQLLIASMDAIPLPDASVDVLLSNGVFNLSADKDRTFAEAYRVLRPGGRMVVADMLLVADLPPALLDNPRLWSGWIAGALTEPVWLGKAAAVGFVDLHVLSRWPMGEDRLPLYPVYQEGGLDTLFALVGPEDRWRLVISATITARKPEGSEAEEAGSAVEKVLGNLGNYTVRFRKPEHD